VFLGACSRIALLSPLKGPLSGEGSAQPPRVHLPGSSPLRLTRCPWRPNNQFEFRTRVAQLSAPPQAAIPVKFQRKGAGDRGVVGTTIRRHVCARRLSFKSAQRQKRDMGTGEAKQLPVLE
jgi:hypothetical protein